MTETGKFAPPLPVDYERRLCGAAAIRHILPIRAKMAQTSRTPLDTRAAAKAAE
jgi:hypothetical protein